MMPQMMPIVRVAVALVLFLPIVPARRLEVNTRQYANHTLDAGPNKCMITWPLKGRNAQVEFGVPSCSIGCKVSNADFRFTRMFAAGFKPVDNGRFCACLDAKGRQVLKYPGSCGDDVEAAKLKCYDTYKVWKTNDYNREPGRKTTTSKPNPQLYADSAFIYDCEEGAFEGGKGVVADFPSMQEGRDDDEQEIFRDALQKNRNGEKLSAAEQDIVETISDEDADAIMFNEYSPDGAPITVGVLRKAQESQLKEGGIDVNYFLTTVEFFAEEQPVDLLAFRRFSKALRETKRKKEIVSDDIAEILFDELSPDAKPIDVLSFKEAYENRLQDSGRSIVVALREAGIPENQQVDLAAFKRFKNVLPGAFDTDNFAAELMSGSEAIKVKALRERLESHILDDGVDVGHALTILGLTSEDDEVDVVMTKRVVKLLRKAFREAVSEDDLEEILFQELSNEGKPVTAKQLTQAYGDEMKETGVDVGFILSSAGITSESDEIDLETFIDFRKTLRKARNGELPKPSPEPKPEPKPAAKLVMPLFLATRSSMAGKMSTICPRSHITVEHEGGMQLSFTLGRTDKGQTMKVFCADANPAVPAVTDGVVTFGCREERRWDVISHTCKGTGNPIFSMPAVLEQDEGQELLMLGVHHRCCCDSEDNCLWYHQDFLTEAGILQEAGKCPRVKKKNGKTCTLDRWCLTSRQCWGSSSRTHHQEDRCEIVTRAKQPEAFFDGNICSNGSSE